MYRFNRLSNDYVCSSILICIKFCMRLGNFGRSSLHLIDPSSTEHKRACFDCNYLSIFYRFRNNNITYFSKFKDFTWSDRGVTLFVKNWLVLNEKCLKIDLSRLGVNKMTWLDLEQKQYIHTYIYIIFESGSWSIDSI